MSVIRGALWGLVIGGAGVSVASVMGPQPAGNTPPATPPLVDAPEVAEVADPVSTVPDAPEAGEATTVTTAPQVTAPTVQTPALDADTDPLPLPETAAIGEVLEAPETAALPQVAAAPDEPVLPTPQGRAPQIPANEGDLTVETTPAQPVVVEEPEPVLPEDDVIVQEIPVETPQVVTAEDAPAAVAVETPDLATAHTADVVAEVEAPTQAAPESVAEAPTDEITIAPQPADETVQAASEDVDATPTAPETADIVAPATVAEDTAADVAETPTVTTNVPAEPASDALTGTEVVDDVQPDAPTSDEPPVVVSLVDENRSSLPQGSGGVKINRVIGSAAAPEAAPETAETDTAATDLTGVPLVDFAATFDNPEDKPILSLVLLDEGEVEAAPALIAQLPFSVTVLIDATKADAAAKTASYRAAGVEVGAVLQMPAGATPTDVEIAMEAVRANLGEAVVITDLGTAERGARDQMIAAMSGEGRGFVSLSKGLSNGLRTAEAAGVPAVAVFRDLDNDNQDARVIRRFLDQAAFRARQDEGVVLLGRVRPDTLSALTLWGTANRAGQVVIGPVSALLDADAR